MTWIQLLLPYLKDNYLFTKIVEHFNAINDNTKTFIANKN